MKMTVILLVAFLPIAGHADDLSKRGLGYLRSQQQADGSFRSATYGNMKVGAATTALALYAICLHEEDVHHEYRAVIAHAVDFLNKGMTKKGFVVGADGTEDYPNYASVLLLLASQNNTYVREHIDCEKLIRFLVSGQLTEGLGWKRQDRCYGGWDRIGGSLVTEGFITGVDISVTSLILEALSREDFDGKDELMGKSHIYLKRSYNEKSKGFYFTSIIAQNLKGGWEDEGRRIPVAYASATCDGLISLKASACNDEYFSGSSAYLEQIKAFDRNYGMEKRDGRDWGKAILYYYYLGFSRLAAIDPDKVSDGQRLKLKEVIKQSQKKDGSWCNDVANMREDDPLIATSLALASHALLSSGFSGQIR